MLPKSYLQKFAAAVVKRCGICQATVEQVLPAVFDEIRYQLIEGHYPCVPIESFGTFAVVDIPERQYHNTYKGADEIKILPATRRLKFAMTRNFKRELQEGRFDPSRRSFSRHPKDPAIRRRKNMKYQPMRHGISKGQTTPVKTEKIAENEDSAHSQKQTGK